MTDTMHIAVLKVLGFTTTCRSPMPTPRSIWGGFFEEKQWELARNGQVYVTPMATTEFGAWASAPTLKYLALELLTAMTTEDYGVEILGSDAHIICARVDWSQRDEDDNGTWTQVGRCYTMPEAIVALFIEVCKATDFDGTQVQL